MSNRTKLQQAFEAFLSVPVTVGSAMKMTDAIKRVETELAEAKADNARLAAALLRLNGHEVIVGYERRFNTPYYQRWTKHTPLENDCSAIAWETVRELIVTPEKALRDLLAPTIAFLEKIDSLRPWKDQELRDELARLRGLVEGKP